MSNPNKLGEIDNASRLMKFTKSLEQAAPSGKHQKQTDFAEAYPTMEQHLAHKMSQKVMLEKFNETYGHTLHPPAFRKMLDEERKRRSGSGEVVACPTCGQQLPVAVKVTENVVDTEEHNHVG